MKWNKYIGYLLGLFLAFECSAASDSLERFDVDYTGFAVTPEGVGPIKLGMNIADAMAQFGITIQIADPEKIDWNEGCSSLLIGDHKGYADIRLLLTYNIIRRIDIYVPEVRTEDDSGVGDSLNNLEQKYHIKKVGAHQIGVSELMVYHESTKSFYLFEGYSNVRSFRVGWEPEVSYIEGCA